MYFFFNLLVDQATRHERMWQTGLRPSNKSFIVLMFFRFHDQFHARLNRGPLAFASCFLFLEKTLMFIIQKREFRAEKITPGNKIVSTMKLFNLYVVIHCTARNRHYRRQMVWNSLDTFVLRGWTGHKKKHFGGILRWSISYVTILTGKRALKWCRKKGFTSPWT